MRRSGIATKLTALILSCAILILGLVVGYTYRASRASIIEMAHDNAAALAQATANKIGAVFSETSKVAATMAVSQEDIKINEPQIVNMSKRILSANPGIFGMAVAFNPFAFDRSRELYAPYTHRAGRRITTDILGGPEYQYPYMDWFQLAHELNKPIWTEPYFDSGGGNSPMITFATPFSRRTPQGMQQVGVVTADIELNWLQTIVNDIKVYETGFVFLLSRHGTFIAHPIQDMVMNETIFTYAEEVGVPEIRELGKRMVAGESGFIRLPPVAKFGVVHVTYIPLPGQNWSLGVVMPESELLASLHSLTNTIIAISVVGALLLAGMVTLVSRSIIRPLQTLTGVTGEIAKGNLDIELPAIASGDEVGDLAESFSAMKRDLKTHIAKLTTTTAAKERIESELRIARDIQMGILPKIFPAFPERTEVDVYATIVPAKEVGGDLYDFFFIDDKQFCFLVGDVSGKGVPAAFFMAVTKTLLKAVAERSAEPGTILAKVNDDLAADNPSCMFVTLFLAILDMETGTLRYANAGHNPPLLLSLKDGPQWVETLEEPMAGAMPDMTYTTRTMQLMPGDTLFMYTDGVTEAMNTNGGLYEESRLLETLTRLAGEDITTQIRGVEASVAAFAGEAEQSDDITMLAVRYVGPRSA